MIHRQAISVRAPPCGESSARLNMGEGVYYKQVIELKRAPEVLLKSDDSMLENRIINICEYQIQLMITHIYIKSAASH